MTEKLLVAVLAGRNIAKNSIWYSEWVKPSALLI
jgi:hypothetical protein